MLRALLSGEVEVQSKEIRVIGGKQKVVEKIIEMIENAKMEVLMTMRYGGTKWGDKKVLDEVIFPRLESAIKKAKKTGSEILLIANVSQENALNLEKLSKWGATIKGLNHGYLRFIVVDENECLFATSVPYTETLHFYNAILSSNHHIVKFYKNLFRSLWLEAKDVPFET